MSPKLLRTLTLLCLSLYLPGHLCQEQDCISGPTHLYTGTHSKTKTGITCQRWDTNEPHEVKAVPDDGGNHNYCRNPDRDAIGTWCYTTDSSVRWEYCGIPKCGESSFVLWTSFDGRDKRGWIDNDNADPELSTQGGGLSTNSIQKVSFENSELRALEVGRNGKEIFFTDIRKDVFGVVNPETLESKIISEGTAKTIYAMSQDWVTANFYWTDTKMKWVYVADRQYRAVLPIYDSTPADPRAIAVQSAKRWLVFSTFLKLNTKDRDTQIIRTDLGGKNEEILFRYPDVIDVTSLAVDDARIYWTDFLGFTSKLMSSGFDGSDKMEHYAKKFASFRDLAVYGDYMYVTDSRIRYNYFNEIRYHIDIVRKDFSQVFTYTKPDVPHGIAILREVKDDELPTPLNGVRECLKSCEGVCIPDQQGRQKCRCPFGYRLQQSTGSCLRRAIRGGYVLALGKGAGKMYQISTKDSRNYTIAPFANIAKIDAAATDFSTGEVYVHDNRAQEIRRGRINGEAQLIHSPTDTGLKHMAVDPISKHIYYTDLDNNINVVSGILRDIIVESKDPSSDIKMIALDYRQKQVYWTDTFSKDGSGRVMKCRFDGKMRKTVLNNLHSPYGITINDARKRLFVLDAKKAIIYEIPLAKLVKIKSASTRNYKKHNLLPLLSSRRFKLTNIVSDRGFIYIADEEKQNILRYNIPTRGRGKLTNFGPSIFHRVTSLSVHTPTKNKSKMAPRMDPCKKKSCRSICISVTRKKAVCS